MMDYSLLGALSIPTLSGTMLILLSLLLFVVAYKVSLKKGAKAGKIFITLIGVTALMSGIGGTRLLSDVIAGAVPGLPLAGTTGSVALQLGYNQFQNDNVDKTLKITRITPPEGSTGCTTSILVKPTLAALVDTVGCAVGVQLPYQTHCQIFCSEPEVSGTQCSADSDCGESEICVTVGDTELGSCQQGEEK